LSISSLRTLWRDADVSDAAMEKSVRQIID